jgi:hypothetical protein
VFICNTSQTILYVPVNKVKHSISLVSICNATRTVCGSATRAGRRPADATHRMEHTRERGGFLLERVGGRLRGSGASSLVHSRSALLATTAEIFVSAFPHRSPPHRFLCSSMRCFENSPRRASSGGLPSTFVLVSHQYISMPLWLFQASGASSHTRFAATRSWRFRRRKLSATTELVKKHKVIFYN